MLTLALTAWRLDVERTKLLVSVLASLGAGSAFVIGLLQYRQAQLWRRKEFIGDEIKAFLDDPAVRNALLMIDWGQRRIPFDPDAERSEWPIVNRAVQVSALRPHILGPASCAVGGAEPHGFSELEGRIRDTYDAFLDGLERLEAFAEARLFQATELGPFLCYWLANIASAVGPTEDLHWRLALLAYTEFYGFTGVQRLFAAFGHDVRVGGALWRTLRGHLESPDFADHLCEVVGARDGGGPGGH